MVMKNADKLIRIALIVSILFSIVLSWLIWTNSGNKQTSKKEVPTNVKVIQKKNPAEVFLPTKLIYHSGGQHQYTNKENLITDIQKDLQKCEFGPFVQIKQNYEQLVAIQMQNDSLEFGYPSLLPIAYYEKIFSMEFPDISSELLFNRLIVSFKDKKLYVMNNTAEEMWEAPILKGNIDSIKQKLQSKNIQYFDVNMTKDTLHNIYYFKEAIRLKKYSYILANQSYTAFSQAFFADTVDLYPNDDSKNINLSNPEGENLSILYATGEVNFTGKPKEKYDPKNKEAIFFEGYDYISEIANSIGNLRYFNNEDNSLIFRSYVEGFPVFSDYSKGRISVTIVNNVVQISTNQETIQVPIPSDEIIELPNTQQTIDELVAEGVPVENIEDIQIGYSWESNEETKQAVDLTPSWYIKFKGRWYHKDRLITYVLEEGESINEF